MTASVSRASTRPRMGAAPAALPTRAPRAVLMLLQVNVFDNDFVDMHACVYYVLISPPYVLRPN
jgi:hypothetical protein